MKIVLVALYDVYSYGVRGLHSLLSLEGFDVTSVYFRNSVYTDQPPSSNDLDIMVKTILDQDPDLIGFGVRSPVFPIFKVISSRIRKRSNAKILVGGHHPTASPDSCLPYADFICRGEGEIPTVDLCKSLCIGLEGDRPDIRGLYPNPPNPIIKNLDYIPFPYYGGRYPSGDNPEIFVQSDPQYGTQTNMSMWSGRGCFFSCSFCFEGILRGIYPNYKVRRLSVSKVMDWITYLKINFRNLKEITFSDHVFTWDEEWLERFSKDFKRTGLKFRCFGHTALITKSMLVMLKDAGLSYISMGLESGADSIRRVFKRREPPAKIVQVSEWCSELGIDARYDVITNNPFDTPETLLETRQIIRKLATPNTIRTFELRYFPGTELTERCMIEGYIEEADIEGNDTCKFGNWHYNQIRA